MAEKIRSEINQLTLNRASYAENPVTITPTLINFFFGNNGTGKSTIAKAIKDDDGIEWKADKSASDYSVLVYDQYFIDHNLSSYNNMPGVFTVNETNVTIQNQINTKTAEKETKETDKQTAISTKSEKGLALDSAYEKFQNSCWSIGSKYKTTFKDALTGTMQKKLFADAVLRMTSAVAHNEDDMKRLYDTAFSKDAKAYRTFTAVDDVSALDTLPNSDILSESIISSSDTEFSRFMKAINATSWVQHGVRTFTETEHKCPFCQQELPDTFEEDIQACFDSQYQNSIDTLNSFKDAYTVKSGEIISNLSLVPTEIHPDISLERYKNKMAVLKGIIAVNQQKISDKINEPSKAVTLEDTKPVLEEISEIIDDFNKLINDNNAIIASQKTNQTKCKKEVWEHIAFLLKTEVADYNNTKAALESDIRTLDSTINTLTTEIRDLESEIAVLNASTVNTSATIESMNTLLRDSGFQGFHLKEKDGVPNVYEVVRPNGDIADTVSEGERNFIAFLYYYHLVKGSESSDGSQKDKIVIIDDPVSSMDNNSLFIVSALVREMIEICKNNATGFGAETEARFIKQIFILTHNAFFHREITYNRVQAFEYISFYHITKAENVSRIKHCIKDNPEILTEKINYTPVKNSYAALWEEYKHATTPVILMSAIRKILEYYFLQLCGYDGFTLRDRILVDHRDDFIQTDAAGNEDRTKFHQASSMLSYISSSSNSIIDGINFVDDGMDLDLAKDVFEMIFDNMGQRQHYEMMISMA